jgi:hypothetical protein
MISAYCVASMPVEERMSCSRCMEWTTSVESVVAVLTNDSSACEGCGRQDMMRIVADQYHKRRPRWWIVDTTVVVPMWIVEYLRTRKPSR